jgi:alkanesulfonate monooxygenase SsuD/methylene tetrahydromethanopterin reductase-like flavin-dependent oxidoreductase (luciferase family)
LLGSFPVGGPLKYLRGKPRKKAVMEAWHFTEMPYPHLPPLETLPVTAVTLPNSYFDPKVGADLYHRYLDEYLIADDLGLNLMLNEHHQLPACINATVPLPAAILARQSKKARILILGNPIANRKEPIRIAEEMAMIDCISEGRLDVGFVRGVPMEIFASNSNPTETVERLWEGIDLVVRTWTTHDGPFNYEGRFWHSRAINIWPRPYQQPHPPIWITGSSDKENIKEIARHGYVFAMFLQPHERVREMFDAYRECYVPNGVPRCGGIAYMPLVHTADSDEEAMRGAEEMQWYLKSIKVGPQITNPPGYAEIGLNVKALQGTYAGRTAAVRSKGIDYLMEQGIVIAGTPDKVAAQIKRFHGLVGGFDHLLLMQQAGFLDHARTVRSMTLFAKEVYPQIKDLPGSGLPGREHAAVG